MTAAIRSLYGARGNSPVHGADPRCKLLLSLILFVSPLLSYGIIPLVMDYAIVISTAAVGRAAASLMKLQLPAVGISAVISASEMLAGYRASVAAATGLRFLDIVAAASLFYLITSVDEVGDVLAWLRVPREASIWITISLRFVPILARDLSQIAESQSSRGMGAGGFLDWLRGLPSLVTPAIATSLIRGREVAEALEIRGYYAGRPPGGARWLCALGIAAAIAMALTAAI